MKKVRLAIIAVAMITSLLPLNSSAATITASRDAAHKGITYDITSDKADDFIKGFEVGADQKQTITFDNALGDWSGYTTFTARIIIEKVLEADAANVDFKVEDTSYNLYENVGSTEDVKADDFAQEICKNVGVIVNGNKVDNSNPMYSAYLDDGVLTVKDVVNGETAKDVKITVDGKVIDNAGKVVTGDSVNVVFDANDEVITSAEKRVWAAAAKMDAKLDAYPDQGVESIFMHEAGADAKINGKTVAIDANYGDFAVFTVKTDKEYEIKSFADTGIIELFQAMFGDVVRADITALTFEEDGTVTEGDSSTIDEMNTMTKDTLRGEIADKLITLLVDGNPRIAKMNELLGKGATAKVTYSDKSTETYSVVFVPSSAISYGETPANINE